MSLVFPESYDELAVLAHHGATDAELARRLAEREAMSIEARWHADVQARAHVGPTIDDHRARWARDDRPAGPPPAASHPDPDAGPAAGVAGTIGPEVAAANAALAQANAAHIAAAAGDVPAGTMADVLGWVGDNPVRAVRAIDAERVRRTDPRTSLIARLERIAEADHG
jgi:hypothetical protein